MKFILTITSLLVGSVLPIIAASPGEQATAGNPALRAFVEQVRRERPQTPDQQAVTVESLQLLATAIESIEKSSHSVTPGIRADLNALRNDTQQYSVGRPESTTQSEQLSRIFLRVANVLDRLSAGSGVRPEDIERRVVAIRRSAAALDVKRPPHRQPDVLERFFHQAAEILEHIAPH